MNEFLAAVFKRAAGKRVFAVGPHRACEEARFAIRRGQAAAKGEPIIDPQWTHACVEGDAAWTDLRTGLPAAHVVSVQKLSMGAVDVVHA